METITASCPRNESVFKNAAYADCVLITSSGTLECSKVLLASRSTFFDKIFNQSHNVGKFVNIVFTDCSFEVLKCAVDIIFRLEMKTPLKLTGQLKFI